MKMIFFVLITVSLIACSKGNGDEPGVPVTPVDTIASGWRKIALPTGQGGTDIFFINSATGFVVGNNFISRSVDGGNTWQKMYRSYDGVTNIAMGSSLNVLLVTTRYVFPSGPNPSTLLFTLDGGNSYDSVAIADTITDAFFASPAVAYAIGRKCWKSTNGGRNWSSIYDFGSVAYYRSLHFLNDQTGWWAGKGGVFKTTNGGLNWTAQPTPGLQFNQVNGNTGNVFFADASIGYISDFESIGKTTDGGTNWTKIYSLPYGYHDLHFLTPAIGYTTDNHHVYKTIDGGTSWTTELVLPNNLISEIHFTDASHGWVCASEGGFYNQGVVFKYQK